MIYILTEDKCTRHILLTFANPPFTLSGPRVLQGTFWFQAGFSQWRTLQGTRMWEESEDGASAAPSPATGNSVGHIPPCKVAFPARWLSPSKNQIKYSASRPTTFGQEQLQIAPYYPWQTSPIIRPAGIPLREQKMTALAPMWTTYQGPARTLLSALCPPSWTTARPHGPQSPKWQTLTIAPPCKKATSP